MPSAPIARTTALIEDVEFLYANGAGWEEILARTGSKPKTLERLLWRRGYQHLTVQARARDRERTYA
jgi:hypothetical protein